MYGYNINELQIKLRPRGTQTCTLPSARTHRHTDTQTHGQNSTCFTVQHI